LERSQHIGSASEHSNAELLREMLTGAHSCLLYSEPIGFLILPGFVTKAEWIAGRTAAKYLNPIGPRKYGRSNAKGRDYGNVACAHQTGMCLNMAAFPFSFPR